MSPPGSDASADPCITGSRNQEAETKRHLAGRVINAMKAAGMRPLGWQVRGLVATLLANREQPSDEEILTELMRAPWFPKPRMRRYRVGEAGWRTAT